MSIVNSWKVSSSHLHFGRDASMLCPHKAFHSNMNCNMMNACDSLAFQLNKHCAANGLMYFDGYNSWSHVPISVYPVLFPSHEYHKVRQLQLIFNELIDIISRDKSFILYHHREIIKTDPFIDFLCDIYESIPEDTLQNQYQLGVHRCDYMLDETNEGKPQLLQVEINTIASSFAHLSSKVSKAHSYFFHREGGYKPLVSKYLKEMGGILDKNLDEKSFMTTNEADKIAIAIRAAHDVLNKDRVDVNGIGHYDHCLVVVNCDYC